MGLDSHLKVFVAGHRGLVGSAIVRCLRSSGNENLVLRSRSEVDLTAADQVDKLFRESRPDYVFLAAAKVGGILANDTLPGDFIRENLAIQLNVLDAARRYDTTKLLFLGSSCVYPKHAPQPIVEDQLLAGPLEQTNEAYAIAKIAGIKMAQAYRRQYGCNFIAAMPANLYGPGDNFDLESSHVLPALIRKFHEAKVCNAPAVSLWGSGRPRREFLHVNDLAEACVFLMNRWDSPEIINVGLGSDIGIMELAQLIKSVVGFRGEVVFDTERPDGMPRKQLDISRITALGWVAKVGLREGLEHTYGWYLDQLGRSA